MPKNSPFCRLKYGNGIIFPLSLKLSFNLSTIYHTPHKRRTLPLHDNSLLACANDDLSSGSNGQQQQQHRTGNGSGGGGAGSTNHHHHHHHHNLLDDEDSLIASNSSYITASLATASEYDNNGRDDSTLSYDAMDQLTAKLEQLNAVGFR